MLGEMGFERWAGLLHKRTRTSVRVRMRMLEDKRGGCVGLTTRHNLSFYTGKTG